MPSRPELARDFYVQMGYTPVQAAAIVGGFMQESGPGLDPTIEDPRGEGSIGIGQWRGPRRKRLKKFAADAGKPATDFETQLRFADYELKNHETKAYAQLQNAKTVPEAAAAMIGYERPKGWTADAPQQGHGWSARLGNAMALVGGADAGKPIPATNDAVAKGDMTKPQTEPLLKDVVGGGKPSAGASLKNAIANIDFSALFNVPDPPPIPELPPPPDPVPLSNEPLWHPMATLQRRAPWSSLLPGIAQAARRRI